MIMDIIAFQYCSGSCNPHRDWMSAMTRIPGKTLGCRRWCGLNRFLTSIMTVATQQFFIEDQNKRLAVTCDPAAPGRRARLMAPLLRSAFVSLPLTAEAPLTRLSITALQKNYAFKSAFIIFTISALYFSLRCATRLSIASPSTIR